MKASLLLGGFLVFFSALIFHIAQWRLRRPKNDVLWLFLIFIFAPTAAAVVWALVSLGTGGPALGEIAAVLILHLALSSAYIQTYPCAQAVSPSLEMLIIVSLYGPKGISEEELSKYFDDAKLVGSRFEDLINTSLIQGKNGVYVLSPVARGIILFFIMFRKLLGLEFKGG